MHKIHMCRSNEPHHQLIAGYLGHKNQQDDCSGPSEETETCAMGMVSEYHHMTNHLLKCHSILTELNFFELN